MSREETVRCVCVDRRLHVDDNTEVSVLDEKQRETFVRGGFN